MSQRWGDVVLILGIAMLGAFVVASGSAHAATDVEIVDADPNQCTELEPGTTQEFELTVDYDIGGETPGHISVTVSEEGYGSTTDEVDLSGYESDDRVTFVTDGEVGNFWEEATVKVSVYAEDSIASSAIDEAYYNIAGSGQTCDANPETIVGQVYDKSGNLDSSGILTVERKSDGERELVEYGERNDGFFEFTDQALLEPGAYRLAIYPEEGGYPPYWGHRDITLSEGEYQSVPMERGGVYITDQHVVDATGSTDQLLFEPGSDIEFELDVNRPRNGDSVTVETYIYPVGDEPSNRPDAVYDHGAIGMGPSTLEFTAPTPQSEGEYEVKFVVETEFSDLDSQLTTDVASGPDLEVAPLEQPQVESKTPKHATQTLVGYNELPFSVSVISAGNGDATVEWFVDDERVATGKSMTIDGSDYELGEYEVRASISDGIDTTDDITQTWTVTLTESEPPELSRIEPAEEVIELRSGDTKTFALDAETDGGGDLSYEWSRDGTAIGTGDSVTQTFDRAGRYTITATVTDEWNATHTKAWTADVGSFRDDPRVTSTASTTEIGVREGVEFLSLSVQNPSVNERAAEVELITELPPGVEVTGNHDVTYGDGTTHIQVGTVAPGEGTSMRINLRVSDGSLRGETFSLPYAVQYYPAEKPDDYHTVNETTEIIVEESSDDGGPPSGTDDGTPGFTALLGIISVVSLILYRTSEVELEG
ncbi:PKD domain-containing protein [Natronorubrum sp. JWXQ-INN-674]|uniref:PKD domain-containing protein n=1 Tax=Natronorubrum halalkaliphilum TaxID=2691917 RepID=A0A6B0VT37_9EURY|nr:PKD domain-containing protein [Natronorubrum halalkaliphilum]MXV63952.1 PKD domain-containing protein [Natronorubrum halalkaliphilum]